MKFKAYDNGKVLKSVVSITTILFLFLINTSVAQDNKAIDNNRQIRETKAKSLKRKKASTKGKRLRARNSSTTANRAIESNTSPYSKKSQKKGGKDKPAKPIGGVSKRIQSKSGEAARSNIYPNKGPFVRKEPSGSESGKPIKSRYTRKARLTTKQTKTKNYRTSSPRSSSRSAETSSGKAFTQKGPFVNSSSKKPKSGGSKQTTRTKRLSASGKMKRTFAASPRTASASRSSESTRKSTSNKYTRKTKLSAGPIKPAKARTVTPRSASQPFVTKGKKNVYWGKFSKGEKPITTDISGNVLRRKNYSTPPNEIIQPKNPYEGRKKSKGDKAYSGTFKSGHVSATKRTEKAWNGDISGHPLRKRPIKQGETLSKRLSSSGGGSISATGKYRSNKPYEPKTPGIGATSMFKAQGNITGIKPKKGAGGSISASGKYKSNKPYSARPPGIGATSILKAQGKINGIKTQKGAGGSISADGKYRSNKPLGNGAQSISANGKYRSNKPFRNGAQSISGNGKYKSNKPLRSVAPSISAEGKYRSNKPYSARPPGIGATSILKAQSKITGIKPKKGAGGSVSGKIWNNNNQPINVRPPGLNANKLAQYENKLKSRQPRKYFEAAGLDYYKGSGAERARKGQLSESGRSFNNDNKPLPAPNYGKGATKLARFQGNVKAKKPEKGGGSVSGKLWNNNGNPIEVRTPKGEDATKVGYSGWIKRPLIRKYYEQNINAHKLSIKKESPSKSMYEVEGLQVAIKMKKMDTNPKAAKGSMPGVKPTKATVKASEYSRSVKVYWSYKHNPSAADASLKTIGPSKSFNRASDYSGKTRLSKHYIHNPNSDKEALKVLAPGRAYARITDYQGNVKMNKYNKNHFPDAKFAHGKQNNVKHERTISTDFKLIWTKLFKKNATQPKAVKEKSLRPRYDKNEKELWKDLYD